MVDKTQSNPRHFMETQERASAGSHYFMDLELKRESPQYYLVTQFRISSVHRPWNCLCGCAVFCEAYRVLWIDFHASNVHIWFGISLDCAERCLQWHRYVNPIKKFYRWELSFSFTDPMLHRGKDCDSVAQWYLARLWKDYPIFKSHQGHYL